METTKTDSLEKILIDKINLDQARADSEFSELCKKLSGKSLANISKKTSKISSPDDLFQPQPWPVARLIDVLHIHTPYDLSHDLNNRHASYLTGQSSPCYKSFSKYHPDNLELSLASAHGQLFNTVY